MKRYFHDASLPEKNGADRAFTVEELEEIATELAMDYGSEPPLWLFLDTLKAKEPKQ